MPTLARQLRICASLRAQSDGPDQKDQLASNTPGDVAVMPRPLKKVPAGGQSRRTNRMYFLFTMSDNPLTARRPVRSTNAWRSETLVWTMANPAAHRSSGARPGGARRDRTDDLVLAKHALSQLSYGPQLAQTQSLGSVATERGDQSCPGAPRATPLALE